VIHRQQRLIKKKPPIFAIVAVCAVVSCGKKGPPLAPLIKLPVAPPDLVAARRGDVVGVSFTVPSTNTDGTRPANVAHAEVYAITAPVTQPPISDASLLKFGTRIGSVEVKAPRDPNHTADEDDPADEVDAPEGRGLDQGAVARLDEPLTPDMLAPVTVPPDKNARAAPAPRTGAPLLGPPAAVPVRTYVAFGTSTRGRKGPLSKRVVVPLVPPPPPPSGADFTYDERAVTLTWSPAAAPAAGDTDLLPARAIGAAPPPAIAYNVYDATKPDAVVRLNATPLTDPTYSDNRVVWGENRCYVVVVAETFDGAVIESEVPPRKCKPLVDTFPPAAPKDLKSIASEGAINLIWEPNAEKDLAGYVVLRGVEPAETLQPITPAPIVEPSFKDNVQPGVSYVYAVRAVDKAGNLSPPSVRVVDTAR
jgi:hypothetical protein